MKITTNNMGCYDKVAGKEAEGVMSLEMFDILADSDKKAKSIESITNEMLFNLKHRAKAFKAASEKWEASQLPEWAR